LWKRVKSFFAVGVFLSSPLSCGLLLPFGLPCFSFQRPALFRYLNLIKLFESLSSLFFTVGAFRFFRRLLAAFQGLRGALFCADFFKDPVNFSI